MDRITSEHRSWNMSRIRSCDTKPEQVVRSVLHRLGFRFRKDSGKRLIGKPDVVLPKYRTVVLVHGCFWHRHARCKFAYTPKSRLDFWSRKFQANRRRDSVVKRHLTRDGWRVVIIWECEITRLGELASKLGKIRSTSGADVEDRTWPENQPSRKVRRRQIACAM
jgi:DNA mismatch endonuclease (patch repair protein)